MWDLVVETLSSYLAHLWAAGGLLGPTAADAGHVEMGPGTTMTDQDILNGIMGIEVEAAIVEPGEYVELSLQQVMQTP